MWKFFIVVQDDESLDYGFTQEELVWLRDSLSDSLSKCEAVYYFDELLDAKKIKLPRKDDEFYFFE